MALQTILRIGTVVVGLFSGGQVFAQTANSPSRVSPSPSQAVAAGPATTPAIRRQPRAADIPASSDTQAATPLDRESPDDAAMNRMISGICRGC